MTNILIVMALQDEGQSVFEKHDIPVIYTGVGKVNATYHLLKSLQTHQPKMVANFGTAGSQTFPTGTLVACHQFVQRDMDTRELGFELGITPFENAPLMIEHPPHLPHLKTGICGSGDSFSTTGSSLACDVVDMEAYALAKVCQWEKIPFICAKYITDGADSSAAEDWYASLHRAAQLYFEVYEQLKEACFDSA